MTDIQVSRVQLRSTEYWDKVFSSRSWGAYPPEELIRFIARNFGNVKNRSEINILEVGCGPGPNVWYLAREGYKVAGIDSSPTAIQRARERLNADRLPSGGGVVDLQVGNFVNLPWPADSFDAAADVSALYANTLADIRLAINEIHRVLKVGGLFFGKMFGTETTGSNTGESIESGTRRRPDIGPCAGNEVAHFFSRIELQELFSTFSDLSIDFTLRSDYSGEVKIFHWLVSARK